MKRSLDKFAQKSTLRCGKALLVAWVMAACAPKADLFEISQEPVLMVDGKDFVLRADEPQLPLRAATAMTGSAFLAASFGLTPAEREEAILRELTAGNIPSFLRTLIPVRLAGPNGGEPCVTVHVMPDYLAIGSDDDYVRMPMNLHTATAVARAFGFALPTSRIVDAIFEQAALRLDPIPLPPTRAMSTLPYFIAHDQHIRTQLTAVPAGALVAGHKKDIVLSTKLEQRPNRIAIYGWHDAHGLPIQPVSTAHGARYVDYSHGVRLVSSAVWFRGERRSFFEALAAPETAASLSNEGPLVQARELMSPSVPPAPPPKN